jgi:hypothetical protein
MLQVSQLIAKQLDIKNLIIFSRTNKLCNRICLEIFSNKSDEDKVRQLMKVASITYIGKLKPQVDIETLILNERIPADKFVIKPTKFRNAIYLKTPFGEIIKIFKGGMIQYFRHPSRSKFSEIMADLNLLFQMENCLEMPLKPILVSANFSTPLLETKELKKLAQAIFPNQYLSTLNSCSAKTKQGSVHLFKSTVIITSKSFQDTFLLYTQIQNGYLAYTFNKKIRRAIKKEDLNSLYSLLDNPRTTSFCEGIKIEVVYNIFLAKANQIILNLFMASPWFRLGETKEFDKVVDNLIYRWWVLKMMYGDIFPLDVIRYLFGYYYEIL